MLSHLRRLAQKASEVLWRWMDRLYYRHAGGEERGVFFDVHTTYPALLEIDRNYDAIRAELDALLPEVGRIPRYHDVDASQEQISGRDERSWHTLFLHLNVAGSAFPNRALCPRTVEVLDSIPEVGQAFFSILEPRKSIPPHCGPHYYYLRYHTAFYVPKTNPPNIRVKDQVYTWKEGESVLFDDSWEHEVKNDSDEIRVVLITDVLRPAPWTHRLVLGLARRLGRFGFSEAEWAEHFEPFVWLPERAGTATGVAAGKAG